jgi:hypothetical protein
MRRAPAAPLQTTDSDHMKAMNLSSREFPAIKQMKARFVNEAFAEFRHAWSGERSLVMRLR